MWAGACHGEANELRRITFLAVIYHVRGLRRDWVSFPAKFAGKDPQSCDDHAVLAVIRPAPWTTRARSRIPWPLPGPGERRTGLTPPRRLAAAATPTAPGPAHQDRRPHPAASPASPRYNQPT